ncbi:MAG TPA: Gfo/Idh/MocA family oxidoreductase [Candidatus Caccousia avistercoris]|nr:Gfo/Idh/MocA family oxidoreductase [Candidatus Caccousia avistercoris]
MRQIKLGILGVGNMGSTHLTNIKEGKCPELTVAAVADVNPARLAWAREQLGSSLPVFAAGEEMMDSGLVEAVLVAVPHYDHPRYAMEAMARGLHVMVEKPAGVYTRQVRQMNEAAARSSVVFGMMFNQRTNPAYQKMRELVQGGSLGQLRRTNWIITNWYRPQAYYDSGSWRATWSGEGGGVLLNQCPHNLDLWQWICGMPVRVSAHMHFGRWHDIEVEDDVTAYVEYENGATGSFVTSTGDAPGTNRFEITLDGGKLVAEDDRLTLWKLQQPEPEFSRANTIPFGQPEWVKQEWKAEDRGPQHVGVLNAFAGAILRGEPLVASGTEGIRGLTLSNAMHLSAWLGREVSLPLDEDLFYEELQKRVKTSRRKETAAPVYADTSGTYGGTK